VPFFRPTYPVPPIPCALTSRSWLVLPTGWPTSTTSRASFVTRLANELDMVSTVPSTSGTNEVRFTPPASTPVTNIVFA
jgi:hypothetical protein